MNTKQEIELQIKKLQEELEKLNESKLTGWKRLECGERYYYIGHDGEIESDTEQNFEIDNRTYNNLTYFSTVEKAEEVSKEQLLYRKLKKFADENNEKESEKVYKIIICDGEISYAQNSPGYREFGQIYFSSKEIVEKAIKTFRTELKEYFKIGE